MNETLTTVPQEQIDHTYPHHFGDVTPEQLSQDIAQHPDAYHEGLDPYMLANGIDVRRPTRENGEAVTDEELEEIGEVADEGAGVVVVVAPKQYGEQLSIESELTRYGQWPKTEAQKGNEPSWTPRENARGFYIQPDISSAAEDKYVRGYIAHSKADEDLKQGNITSAEHFEKIADKSPRTYQYPLLRQNGELFKEDEPVAPSPTVGAAEEDGTFWHTSNHLMEPGDRLMPSGEVPDAIHDANKANRSLPSTSAPEAGQESSSREMQKDFAFGTPRDNQNLNVGYGQHVYKVSSANAKIMHPEGADTKEVWAEGGARIVQRMNPDFASNYDAARAHINAQRDPFQPALPEMEAGMKFVPENELNDLSQREFNDKYLQNDGIKLSDPTATANQLPGPDDAALPGLEHYGKKPYAPDTSQHAPFM